MYCKGDVVYILFHYYEDGDEDEQKDLGIYSSRERAEEAKQRYFVLPGFNRYPIECFLIGECVVDKDDAWTDGFVSTDEIAKDFEILTRCINDWMGIDVSVTESWNDDNYYEALCDIDRIVYRIKSPEELSGHIADIWRRRFPEISRNDDEYPRIAKKILASLKLLYFKTPGDTEWEHISSGG